MQDFSELALLLHDLNKLRTEVRTACIESRTDQALHRAEYPAFAFELAAPPAHELA